MTTAAPARLMSLADGLRLVATAVPAPRRSIIPLVVGFDPVDRDSLRLTLWTGDFAIEAFVEGSIAKPLTVGIDTVRLVTRALRKPEIRYDLKGSLHFVSSFIRLDAKPVSDEKRPPWPELADPAPEGFYFNREDYLWALGDAAQDDSRPILRGVLVTASGAMAASDGFRLRYVAREADDEQGIVIPAIPKKVLPTGELRLRASPTYMEITGDTHRLLLPRLIGTFPAYKQLIPKEEKWRFVVERAAFEEAVTAMTEVAAFGPGIVRIETEDGQLKLSAKAEDVGQVSALVPATIEGQPRIALNAAYLAATIATFGEEITVCGINESSQLHLLDGGDRREVIMPMWVSW